MMLSLGLVALTVLSFVLTGLLRRYALARSLMDVPNERSSHVIPTPRGGGVAIVIGFLVALLVLWYSEVIHSATALGLGLGGGLVAAIGFLDDHGHIAARWRLLGHFVAGVVTLFCLQGVPAIPAFGGTLEPNAFWLLCTVIYLVWLLNLYNFMDGIDGIAGIEALTVCLGGVILSWLGLGSNPVWLLPATLGVAALGFLIWNFPPAKIFMGDAGSGFLGFVLAAMAIVFAHLKPPLFWSWIILLGVFVVDATVTLIRRALRRQRLQVAHRSHAYQHASRMAGAHRPVSLAVAAINLFWLLPAACLAALGWLDGVIALLIAYVPLIGLAVYYAAGAPEKQLA
ncbi:MraY family glycosyltransferase [Chitinolyticbacter meiyuanensis]|uniref:MraY family glycosyltransferase n=1 Tax=Chitinolyticbacter meiyuanensis TaxID=682798 RepID=UPI0011E59B1E|nr:glycosyltransferase family 4 protein [Chitinolyticbacter meiyuanensis]